MKKANNQKIQVIMKRKALKKVLNQKSKKSKKKTKKKKQKKQKVQKK